MPKSSTFTKSGIVAALDEHHVLGLEVAVHDALRVRLAGGVAELQRDVERARQRQRAAGRREGALERQAVEVLHHDVHRAVGELPDEEDVDDVRVRQARRDLRLAVEARDERLVGGELAVEDLHRDVAVDAPLEGAVDAPHRADADELPDLDVAEDLAADVGVVGRGGRDRARATSSAGAPSSEQKSASAG